MIAIQLVSAQIGRVTGKGIIANVKDFAPRWGVISLVATLVMANTFNIAADLAAMGESLSLVIGGLNHEPALIFAAASVLLQIFVRYRRYAPALKFLTRCRLLGPSRHVAVPTVVFEACGLWDVVCGSSRPKTDGITLELITEVRIFRLWTAN